MMMRVSQESTERLVLNPDMGLCYPGGWPLRDDPQTCPSDFPTEDDLMLSLVRRPALPIIPQSIPGASPSAPSTTNGSNSFPWLVFPQGISNAPSDVEASRAAISCSSKKPSKYSCTSPTTAGLVTEIALLDVSAPCVTPVPNGQPPFPSALATTQWIDETASYLLTLKADQRKSKKAIVFMSNAIQTNSTDICTLKEDVTDIKQDSARILRFMERVYGKLDENPKFQSEVKQGLGNK